MAAAINARTPNATPTPMPIFALWLRPLFGVGVAVGDGVDVADGVGSEVVLLVLGLVFEEEGLPVAWLQVTGFSLLSIATLKLPLRA